MKFLYVPWRSKYVKNARNTKKENATEDECAFCKKLSENNDQKNFILGKYKYNFVILNLHPYNTGHTMVLPLRHVKNLTDLNREEQNEFIFLTSQSTQILQNTLNCDGLNIGANLGKAAGAGIPSHLHMHILPRWTGDTNFLPLLAETKTISFDLNKIYAELKPHFDAILQLND
jgi:ATP adenylyltransferase